MRKLSAKMKNGAKNNKAAGNGRILSPTELLAAHEDAIRILQKMTPEEGFQILVRAGIYTPKGQLTRRYGGRAKNQPAAS
jgi:hypothetical protein